MEISGTVLFLLVLLVVIVFFLVGGCSLSCSEKSHHLKGHHLKDYIKDYKGKEGYSAEYPLIEGYKRSCLAGDCFGLQRTPVDYAMKYPHGWQRNPHYKAQPSQ